MLGNADALAEQADLSALADLSNSEVRFFGFIINSLEIISYLSMHFWLILLVHFIKVVGVVLFAMEQQQRFQRGL